MAGPANPKSGRKASSSRRTEWPLLKKRIPIRSQQGLHARPAALFCRVANRFKSTVQVRKGQRVVDGKSIMGVLTLAASRGSSIEITAQGPDARDLLRVLEQLVARSEPPAVVTVLKHRPSHGA